jgi:hypothetical protein
MGGFRKGGGRAKQFPYINWLGFKMSLNVEEIEVAKVLDEKKLNWNLAHSLKEIVKENDAILTYVCEGKVYYEITVYTIEKPSAVYQLEIDSTTDEWKATYLYPRFKAITLMRWIRKGIENGKLIQIK